jgi:hypothetical protein
LPTGSARWAQYSGRLHPYYFLDLLAGAVDRPLYFRTSLDVSLRHKTMPEEGGSFMPLVEKDQSLYMF